MRLKDCSICFCWSGLLASLIIAWLSMVTGPSAAYAQEGFASYETGVFPCTFTNFCQGKCTAGSTFMYDNCLAKSGGCFCVK